jgi:methylated-DNA-[protein]-cysteine S-methyltransferase
MTYDERVIAYPWGSITLRATAAGLSMLHLDRAVARPSKDPSPAAVRTLDLAHEQLVEFFAGSRTRFDLPLDRAGSSFQHAVWAALLNIPYGTTVSYGDVARRIGMPTAAQAVGLACGSNPIAIVVPCHRVIGADGRLTGFAGGLERKRDLLAWEQRESLLF